MATVVESTPFPPSAKHDNEDVQSKMDKMDPEGVDEEARGREQRPAAKRPGDTDERQTTTVVRRE